MSKFKALAPVVFSLFVACAHAPKAPSDPYLWLEDASSPRALEWVKQMNEVTQAKLVHDPYFQEVVKAKKASIDAEGKLPEPTVRGEWVYNVLVDIDHPQGLWRRVALKDYVRRKAVWETVLDLDALSKQEGKHWVWRGATCWGPAEVKCLISLSNGGEDFVEVREFDTQKKSFVKGGFSLPRGRSYAHWMSPDEVLFSFAFDPSERASSLYPIVVRHWHRGQDSKDAQVVYRGSQKSTGVWAEVFHSVDGTYFMVNEYPGFRDSIKHWLKPDGTLQKLDLPINSEIDDIFAGQAIVYLRDDWNVDGRTFKRGSYISFPLEDPKALQAMVEPDAHSSTESIERTRNAVYVKMSHDVESRLLRLTWNGKKWIRKDLKIPHAGNLVLTDTSPFSNAAFATFESYLSPLSVYRVDQSKFERLYSSASLFDSKPYVTEQFWATSKDGTKVPYYVVHRRSIKKDGQNPALMYGYGAGNISNLPFYVGEIGPIWLNKGGIYVSANMRGGGEFGPGWAQAALRENKPKTFEDFEAVADDLARRGFTQPKKLAIYGGSWGGLLTSSVEVRSPNRFGAVVSSVPMTDMLRYPLLGTGSTWLTEFGDPADPKYRSVLLSYSPYHNVKPGVKYPPILFLGASDEDRCGPGHWRKMAARMKEYGDEVFLYEKPQGGHGTGGNPDVKAYERAMLFTFVKQHVMN